MEMESNIFDTALIFEGGGMRVSYTAALANALLENELFFDNVYGLSAGASNTVNYVSRDTWRIRASFVDIVEMPNFGGIGSFLTHKGIFNAHSIYQEMGLPEGPLPFRMAKFLENPAKATIESFDRDTGESVYWTKEDMSELDDLMVRVRASSTLPLAMPSPEIDGRHYYDGGLGEGAGFLLPKAQRDGFKRFFIVRTRPKSYRKAPPDSKTSAAFDKMFWRRPAMREALETRWERYNAMCDEIERLEANGDAYVFYAENQGVESGESDLKKLTLNYNEGWMQAQRDMPKILEFLNL